MSSFLTTRMMVVNDHRGPAGNDSQGVPGFNPCLGDVNINGTTVNYLNYLVRKLSSAWIPISSILGPACRSKIKVFIAMNTF
jgi:hypothetical protein